MHWFSSQLLPAEQGTLLRHLQHHSTGSGSSPVGLESWQRLQEGMEPQRDRVTPPRSPAGRPRAPAAPRRCRLRVGHGARRALAPMRSARGLIATPLPRVPWPCEVSGALTSSPGTSRGGRGPSWRTDTALAATAGTEELLQEQQRPRAQLRPCSRAGPRPGTRAETRVGSRQQRLVRG